MRLTHEYAVGAANRRVEQMMEWFTVDKEGLAKLMERRGREFMLYELTQNAWDADGVTSVGITLKRVKGAGNRALLTVIDDSPDGFSDLSHAFTLFAESNKKADPTKRGRFNLGEKLMLAMCERAEIRSTKGGVRFDKSGRHDIKERRQAGSVFEGVVELTDAEIAYCSAAMKALLPPADIITTYDGDKLLPRKPLMTVTATLPTELADDHGRMRRTRRATTVKLYEPLPGETAKLYEMGIPVVETGDKYHVDVGQKLILNFDRDNVTPAFLAEIRALVVENVYTKLTVDDANSAWVRDAVAQRGEDMPAAAVTKLVELRFGPKVVSFDMVDREANSKAAAAGYTVVQGGQMSGAEWAAIKRVGAIQPAGQVTPSNMSRGSGGLDRAPMPASKYTIGMAAVAALAKRMTPHLIERDVTIEFINDATWHVLATYGAGLLTFNVGTLGYKWFDGPLADVVDLIIHEIAHEFKSNHLSTGYYDALTRLAGAAVQLALDNPGLYKSFDGERMHKAAKVKS